MYCTLEMRQGHCFKKNQKKHIQSTNFGLKIQNIHQYFMPTTSQSTLCQTGFHRVTNIQSVSHLTCCLIAHELYQQNTRFCTHPKTFSINKSPDCTPEVTFAFLMMIMLMRHSIDQITLSVREIEGSGKL